MNDNSNDGAIFVINPNGHYFVLEIEKGTHTSNTFTADELVEHGLIVFHSLQAMLNEASHILEIPVQDLEGNEIVFKQVAGEWGEQCPDHVWMIKDQIEDREMGQMTFLQFLAQYEL